MTTPEKRVAIVGAGVFGLSTALHLARGGYKDVTVFDYQPYDVNAYNPDEGCDAASADVNKIYRCSYGDEIEYQNLAYAGRPVWEAWNEEVAATPANELPRGLTPETRLFEPCGIMRFSTGKELSEYDRVTLRKLREAGLGKFNYVLNDPHDAQRFAELDRQQPEAHWKRKVDRFAHFRPGSATYFESSGGLTYADKACTWARHLCEKAGVKFVLGEQGRLASLIVDGAGAQRRVTGIVTSDGGRHMADVVVLACGAWTPEVLPETDQILEATSGSVVTIQLPHDRHDLWVKFSPTNMPVWAFAMTGHDSVSYGGVYGFPRTPEGKIKMAYRGCKWTNFQTLPSGARISVPLTKYTSPKQTTLPKQALDNIKGIMRDMFPELLEIGITDTRMCWYTDSVDNNFVVDYVPGYNDTLFACTGGSGHGFKFLPVLGRHVRNALEKRPDQFTPLWKWRERGPGRANGLEEGEFGGRNLAVTEMASQQDMSFAPHEQKRGSKL